MKSKQLRSSGASPSRIGGSILTNIEYAEYDAIHRGDFVYDLPNGLDAYLLLFVHTPAIFSVDGKSVEYPANTITLFRPHQKIYYRACEDRYANDWIRFTSDEPFVVQSPIPNATPISVSTQEKSFHRLFQLICYEKERDSYLSERVVSMLLEIIFTKLGELLVDYSSSIAYSSLQELRTNIYQYPNLEWNLKNMAAQMNISLGHLSSTYKKAFGITCKADLINSRISLAKKYLASSDYTVNEIAELCGYQNPEHFVRQFKKMTNSTPGGYRKDHIPRNRIPPATK